MSLFHMFGVFAGGNTLFNAAETNLQSDVPIEPPIASPRNVLTPGPINLGGITGNVVGNVPSDAISWPSGTQTQPASNVPQQSGTLPNAPPGVSWPSGSSSSSPLGWLLSERVASGAIGLICIVAGLFMFQSTRELVLNTAKTAATVA